MSTLSDFRNSAPSRASDNTPSNVITTQFDFTAGQSVPTYPAGMIWIDLMGCCPLALITSDSWLAANITFKMMPLYAGNIVTVGYGAIANMAKININDSTLVTDFTLATDSGARMYELPATLFNSVSKLAITSSVAQTNGAVARKRF